MSMKAWCWRDFIWHVLLIRLLAFSRKVRDLDLERLVFTLSMRAQDIVYGMREKKRIVYLHDIRVYVNIEIIVGLFIYIVVI